MDLNFFIYVKRYVRLTFYIDGFGLINLVILPKKYSVSLSRA